MSSEAVQVMSLFGVPAILVGLYSYTLKKIRSWEKKNKSLELGMQALLRDRIIQAYNHYMEQGFCPIYGKENVSNMYTQYHNLGGNGTMTKLYAEIMNLPTEFSYKKAKP